MMQTLKRIAKILLIAIIAFHLAPVLVWLLGLIGYLNVGNSYISHVYTPSNSKASAYLEELNNRGYGEVVKDSGSRPIFVVEDNLNKIEREGYILGVTWALPAFCLIVMDNNLPPETYRQTIWHEYLHCFYYGHSNKKHDIMAAYLDPQLNEDTVDNYLKELKEIYE